jgi:hypothetical protein
MWNPFCGNYILFSKKTVNSVEKNCGDHLKRRITVELNIFKVFHARKTGNATWYFLNQEK